MLNKQTFKAEPSSFQAIICIEPGQEPRLYIEVTTPNICIKGEELARFQRWLTEPGFKG